MPNFCLVQFDVPPEKQRKNRHTLKGKTMFDVPLQIINADAILQIVEKLGSVPSSVKLTDQSYGVYEVRYVNWLAPIATIYLDREQMLNILREIAYILRSEGWVPIASIISATIRLSG